MTATLLTLYRANQAAAGKALLETPEGRRLSYGDFEALSARIANALRSLGVVPGDRVAAQTDKSPEALALYWGALRAGAVYLPLNAAYTLAELDYFINDAQPRLVVCRPQVRGDLAAMVGRCGPDIAVATLDDAGGGSLSELARGQAADFADHAARSDELASILYTSGTTGRPKGAMLSHGNLASNAVTLKDYWRFTAADVLLHALPNSSNPYDGERIAGSVGFPLPGVELRVSDPQTGRALPRGEVGMIEVRGPNVFMGYWRMPEKSKHEFRQDGFFITGDFGQLDEKGHLRIVGRGTDLIISGGFNVYPKEVELVLDAIDGVRESAVVGVPHPDFGEGVAAVVVTEPARRLSEAGIQRALADKLAKFKQPKRVFFVESLPRNAMGKVQKNLLREQYGSAFVAARMKG